MLNSSPYMGLYLVRSFRAVAERLAPVSALVYPAAQACIFELLLRILRAVSRISEYILAGVLLARRHKIIQLLAVVNLRAGDCVIANYLVLGISHGMVLVAVIADIAFLRPSRIQILLRKLGLAPIRRYLAFVQILLVFLGEMLARAFSEAGVNH